jgi:hypothetical protein
MENHHQYSVAKRGFTVRCTRQDKGPTVNVSVKPKMTPLNNGFTYLETSGGYMFYSAISSEDELLRKILAHANNCGPGQIALK